MSGEPTDLKVENALLRASLFLTANVLKDYHGARHTKTQEEGFRWWCRKQSVTEQEKPWRERRGC